MNKKKAMSNREEKKKLLPPDVLKRGDYVEMVRQVIENKIDNKAGYSLAVDGQWGSGKTYVLQMLEKQLETRALVFHYNAWERDYYDEPLMALVSVFLEQMKENRILPEKDEQKEFTDNLIEIIELMGDLTGLRQIKGAAKILKFVKKHERQFLSPKEIDSCLPLTAAVGKLHSALADLSEKRPVVLIVDELDRCLPEYAVKVLERLHHIVGETQIILITAVDASRLAHSIYNVFYGTPAKEEEVRPFFEKYMTKFVDILIPLPVGKPDKTADTNLLLGIEKEYTEQVGNRQFVSKSFLFDSFTAIMEGILRRDQEKILNHLIMCHKLTDSLAKYKLSSYHYGILIYELLTVIAVYYLKQNDQFQISNHSSLEIKLYSPGNSQIEKNVMNEFKIGNDPYWRNNKIYCILPYPKSIILSYFLKKEDIVFTGDLSNYSAQFEKEQLFLFAFNQVVRILNAGVFK